MGFSKTLMTSDSRGCQLVVGQKKLSFAFLSCLIPQNQKCQHNSKTLQKDFSGHFLCQEFENCRFPTLFKNRSSLLFSYECFLMFSRLWSKIHHSTVFQKLLESEFFTLHSLNMETLFYVRMLCITEHECFSGNWHSCNTSEVEHQWPLSINY